MRNYRYAVERTLRALGGWIALTPELSAKLLMGRHVWDLAQLADAFGARLPELRAHAQVSEPANERVVAFMDAVEEPEAPGQTVERLVGVYRVLKPHLLASYHDHLIRDNHPRSSLRDAGARGARPGLAAEARGAVRGGRWRDGRGAAARSGRHRPGTHRDQRRCARVRPPRETTGELADAGGSARGPRGLRWVASRPERGSARPLARAWCLARPRARGAHRGGADEPPSR